MVALKGRAIDTFLRRPDAAVVLVYGPDAGLVSERADALLATVDAGDDPFAQVTLDGDAVADDPQRLVEEAWQAPLFGGRRAIRVTRTSRNLEAAVAPLLHEPPGEALVVVVAGDLKPSSPLRKAFEASKTAAAVPCYADDDAAIDRLIDEEAARSGLRFSADARAAIHRLTGGDRLASRGEITKIALYCHGAGEVTVEDVAAVAGDAAAVVLDDLADAVGLGDAATADRTLSRLLAAGTAPSAVSSTLARHFRLLADIRRRIDDGATAESAIRAARPRVFYKRETPVRRQATMWPAEALARAGDLIQDRELEIRRRPELAEAIIGRCILTLARGAGRQ